MKIIPRIRSVQKTSWFWRKNMISSVSGVPLNKFWHFSLLGFFFNNFRIQNQGHIHKYFICIFFWYFFITLLTLKAKYGANNEIWKHPFEEEISQVASYAIVFLNWHSVSSVWKIKIKNLCVMGVRIFCNLSIKLTQISIFHNAVFTGFFKKCRFLEKNKLIINWTKVCCHLAFSRVPLKTWIWRKCKSKRFIIRGK